MVLVVSAGAARSSERGGEGKAAAVSTFASGYRIGPEDILDISVWKEDGLKREVLVRPDGGISFPLLGHVQAAGKTLAELQQEITGRIQQYVPDAVVTVAVLRIASNKIYVIGRVNKPGEYVAGRYLDVLQALSLAGGLTPYAAENDIKVVRKEDGRDIVHTFRYSQVKAGRNLEQNIRLNAGDVVVVP